MSHRAAIVGAGLGGLAAATLLAKAGWQVTVFEQRSAAGGKAASRQLGAYRFDTGPSLYTMPWVFRDFFREAGLSVDKYLKILPLEPLCHYFWPDGSDLYSSGTQAAFGKAIAGATSSTAAELAAYLEKSAAIWQTAGELFLCNSLHEKDTYLTRAGIASILKLPTIGALGSLHRANRRAFKDARIVQLFDRYATYNGSSPFRTPGTMRIIPHVEYSWGGWAVEGGIIAVAKAFEQAASDSGVRIHTGHKVERILLSEAGALSRRPRVRGLQVAGRELPFDLVVSNADVLRTYRELLALPDAPEARRYRKLTAASSGIVFLWGIRRKFNHLEVHNIFFSADYKKEFSQIFGGAGAPEDPTIYINISSRTSPSDAPDGCENWFVLVNTSNNTGQDWPTIAARLRERVVARLGKELDCDLASLIEEEAVITPVDIENETGSTGGSLYGIASNQLMAAFLRHPNRSRRIGGLYFAGGSAHPGGGMPLAVLSGSIAARLAIKYEQTPPGSKPA